MCRFKLFLVFLCLISSIYAEDENQEESSDEDVDGRIVGGAAINITTRKYQLAVLPRMTYVCGGSLLTPSCVITAAHCTDGFQAFEIAVRAGSNYWNQQGELLGTDTIYQHEKFNHTNLANDISILKLTGAFVLGPRIGLIKLARTIPPVGTIVIVSGFGYSERYATFTDSLNSVAVQIFDRDQCNINYENFLSPGTICANAFGKDSCKGDSGGPMTVYNETLGRDLLLGIVSFGSGCANITMPGVYTSVPDFFPWISKIMTAYFSRA